ncbi:MAG TPA: MFS transporter, partial [Mycobacterium sp.]|nr:MFS transporter [Mycobacterium sp.]
ATIGFVVTGTFLPLMFYAQAVCGLSPTRSALLTAPMAVATGLLAPVVGRIVDRAHPTAVIGFGFSVLAIALTWLSIEMTATTPIWRLLLPFMFMGVGMAFIWAPLAATATRNLPPVLAGAGSGVYNATRQVGSVLGSAGIAAFMSSRISAELPTQSTPAGAAVSQLPAFLREPFSSALSQSMLLPAFVALFGVVAAIFLAGSLRSPRYLGAERPAATPAWHTDEYPDDLVDGLGDEQDPLDPWPGGEWRRRMYAESLSPDIRHPEGYVDDDDDGYFEFSVQRSAFVSGFADGYPALPEDPPFSAGDDYFPEDDPTSFDTEPLTTPRVFMGPWDDVPPVRDPGVLHDIAAGPVGLFEEQRDDLIGFVHNGFHTESHTASHSWVVSIPASDNDWSAKYLSLPTNSTDQSGGRHALVEDPFEQERPPRHSRDGAEAPPAGRHRRYDADDADEFEDVNDADDVGVGRHSAPRWD